MTIFVANEGLWAQFTELIALEARKEIAKTVDKQMEDKEREKAILLEKEEQLLQGFPLVMVAK